MRKSTGKNLSLLRYPDLVLLENQELSMPDTGLFTTGDVTISTLVGDDCLRIQVTAKDTPLKKIRLRWLFISPLRGKVLGDAWERTYGDMCWQTMLPYKTLPWYCMIKEEDLILGFGVRVRPSALCSWQVDPSGITLWLDVRCGGEGVVLKGRNLLAAEVVSRSYEGLPSFEAASSFMKELCSDPLLPPCPIYGSNN